MAPVSLNTICLYAQFLSRSFKTVAAIRNYLSGVKLMHLHLGLDCPNLNQYDLTTVLKGLARLNPHCPKQALPITPEILNKIYFELNHRDPADSTLWCMMLLGFFLMLRKSNLVPLSQQNFDPQKNLCRGDITCAPDCMLVVIKWSKTIQFGERKLTLPLVAIDKSYLCPVRAFKKMTKLNPAPEKGPAFVVRGKPVTYMQLQIGLREAIGKIGLEPKGYSSHSLRRGGATWAFRSRVPGELIQLHGDWASDAYKNYLHFPLESKFLVAKKMTNSILKLC